MDGQYKTFEVLLECIVNFIRYKIQNIRIPLYHEVQYFCTSMNVLITFFYTVVKGLINLVLEIKLIERKCL